MAALKQKYVDLIRRYNSNYTQFVTELQNIAGRLKIPIDWLADVIYSESEFNPAAKNPGSTASGLMQWIDSTARGYGTSSEKLRAMSGFTQLLYVEKYFKSQINLLGHPKTFMDLYCMVFYPAWVNAPDSTPLTKSAYSPNAFIDGNKDGVITKAEFRKWVYKRVERTNDVVPVAATGSAVFLAALAVVLYFKGFKLKL